MLFDLKLKNSTPIQRTNISQNPIPIQRVNSVPQNPIPAQRTNISQQPYFKKQTHPIQQPAQQKEKKLRIIALGGLEEVGRNMTLFEYGQDIIILDMGLQFPEENMPGIDYIIPNIEYLRGKEKNIRGVIFSHGHLDHIGAAPILLGKLGNPLIIGRDMTIAMIKHRQEDYEKNSAKKLKIILIKNLHERLRLGSFKINFFQIEHSIIDAFGIIIKTPVATIIHPGDWTLEKNSENKPVLDYSFLSRLPRPTILMLESLGAIDVRRSASADEMKKNLAKLINETSNRLIVGTFSSQIERISWIIETAEKIGKKVALGGYSMKVNVEIAKKLGYIKADKGTLIKIEQAKNYPDNKVIILCTGAQGEGNAVLSRIVKNQHPHIKLKKTDTVVFSSSIIPGNERTVQQLKDNLYRQCDNVIHGDIMDIHVSGHGNRNDIIYMLQTIKPTYFIPVYAYHYMLKEAAKLAKKIGIEADKIFIPDNGQIIEVTPKSVQLINKKVPANYVFVDGLGITDSNNVVLRDRKMMAEDGMLVIISTIDSRTGKLIGNPDLISRGFVYMKENKELIEQIRSKAKKIFKENDPRSKTFDMYLKDKIRNDLGQFVYTKTQKRPMILPVLIEV
ncbi:ribonuclease J [Candidatus Kuenenbacteria bacterium]|nr:ribonuclease J [Candidatus Kuenenbacteria bacterium]